MPAVHEIPDLLDPHLVAYEEGFLAACEAQLDGLPEQPSCPYEPGSAPAQAWATGVIRARETLRSLDPEIQPELF